MAGPILPSVQQWLDWKLTNILPKAGGTLDQDPQFMQDFRFIVSTENKLIKQQEDAEKLKRKLHEMMGNKR